MCGGIRLVIQGTLRSSDEEAIGGEQQHHPKADGKEMGIK